ncbi:MAG: glycosyltransferase [Bryobacterales bacterium]|nr:glycosyltransferase [Bryobacterales bacterium]
MSTTVSILIPCYNAERWIGQAIESALSQTWPQCELLVVDDGSTDASVSVVKSFGTRVRLERSNHAGGNAARNRLLDRASGEWVQYLDADDYLLPEKVARDMEFLALTRCDGVCSPVILRDEQTGKETPFPFEEPLDLTYQYIRWGRIQTSGLLLRRHALKDAGGWKEDQPCCQEHEMLLRMMLAGKQIALHNQPGVVYRQHGTGTVSRKDPLRTIRERMALTDRLAAHLESAGRMSPLYRRALFTARLESARSAYRQDADFAVRIAGRAAATGVRWVEPTPGLPYSYQLARCLLGFQNAERLASFRRG